MQLLYRDSNVYTIPHLSMKELAILSEIGLGEMPTATEFVELVAEKYEVSVSGVWYTLKKLKREGHLDFTEKGEEERPLHLTESGIRVLRANMKRMTGGAEEGVVYQMG